MMPTYQNGHMPPSELSPTVIGGQLRRDAALAADRLAGAFQAGTGVPLRATDTYRSYAEQVAVKIKKGSLAAKPGTSNHGLGLAVDFASGIPIDTSPTHRWMDAHAREYGWINPSWAQDRNPANGAYEPWHWEYVPELDRHAAAQAPAARPPSAAPAPPRHLEDPMIYRARNERTPYGIYGHNGGWVELASRAEYDNLKKAGVPEVWVEPHTLQHLIDDARSH